MKIVYLDHMKWIALSRVAHGLEEGEQAGSLLNVLREAAGTGQAVFPVSWGHLIEIQSIRSAETRKRLASFMRDLSGRWSVLHWVQIAEREVDESIARLGGLGQSANAGMDLLAPGFRHIMGPQLAKAMSIPGLENVSPGLREYLQRETEIALLAGVNPDGSATVLDPSQWQKGFMGHLAEAQVALHSLPPTEQNSKIYEMVARDLTGPIRRSIQKYGLPSDMTLWSSMTVQEFFESLPSVRMEMHLMRQWVRNPSLTPKKSDFVDWSHVAPMSMYCDIVVTEKHLADLMNRPGIVKKAEVITDLARLPALLAQ
jgi:hypothetical protein